MIPNITETDMQRMGGELDRLIKSEAFETAITLLKEQYSQTFMNTAPEEKVQREEAYRLNKAVDELIGTLQSMAMIASAEDQRQADE